MICDLETGSAVEKLLGKDEEKVSAIRMAVNTWRHSSAQDFLFYFIQIFALKEPHLYVIFSGGLDQ